MTRGTFYYITRRRVLETIEFNGGMYPDEYGDDAMRMLRKVTSQVKFKEIVERFNAIHHGYQERPLVMPMRYNHGKYPGFFSDDYCIDFREDYFARFFSDWLFIKNASGNRIEIIDSKGVCSIIKVGETIRLYFGKLQPESRTIAEKTTITRTGWWKFSWESTSSGKEELNELNNSDLQHIGKMIEQGNTEGQIVQEEEDA